MAMFHHQCFLICQVFVHSQVAGDGYRKFRSTLATENV